MSRKLHIGGKERSDGWEVLNITPADYVDHVCDARDLSSFADGTFGAVYASHVAEHLDYQGELLAALKEWRRVLQPGGKLYVSVPDLDILAYLLLQKEQHTVEERYHVMRMLFGGHIDQYDYHVVGLNHEFMEAFLIEAGFTNMQRVGEFGFFRDTSCQVFKDIPISLNIIAENPAR